MNFIFKFQTFGKISSFDSGKADIEFEEDEMRFLSSKSSLDSGSSSMWWLEDDPSRNFSTDLGNSFSLKLESDAICTGLILNLVGAKVEHIFAKFSH